MVLIAKDQDTVQSLRPPLKSDDRNGEQEEFINALNALGRKRLACEMKTWRSPAFLAVMRPINSSSPKPREDRSTVGCHMVRSSADSRYSSLKNNWPLRHFAATPQTTGVQR